MPLSNQQKQQVETVSYCSFSTLLKQTAQARLLHKGRHRLKRDTNNLQNIHAPQSGKHLSAYKGQGMDFHESRNYQTGDDIRHIDWRVTAKTGKPHTKVFTEERERPLMLIVDMRKPMFFGTKNCYKSVLAAKIASILVWKTLLDGDKAGGIILSDSRTSSISASTFASNTGSHKGSKDRLRKSHKPSRSQAAASRFVNSLAQATQTVDFSDKSAQLAETLKYISSTVDPIINKGAQLIILSDFRGLDEDAKCKLLSFANRTSLTLLSISDPFEESLATYSGKLLLTDGSKGGKNITLTQDMQTRYQQRLESRQKYLKELSLQPNIQCISFSTADQAPVILSKLAGGFL